MSKFKTECAICEKEIEVDMDNFKRGKYGEPTCDDCDEKEGE